MKKTNKLGMMLILGILISSMFIGTTSANAAVVNPGTLTINKTAIGGDDSFEFEVTQYFGDSDQDPVTSNLQITTVNGVGSVEIPINGGSYSVAEYINEGSPWVWSDLECTSNSEGFEPGYDGSFVLFSIYQGQNVTCDFTNTNTDPTTTTTTTTTVPVTVLGTTVVKPAVVSLPETGSDNQIITLFALALIASGAAFFIASRKRKAL